MGSLPSWTISGSLISASRSPHRYFRRSSIPQARRRLHRCPRCWRSRRTANSSSYPIEHTPRSGCICSSAPTTDAHAIPAALPSPARAVVLAGANAALSELVNLISLIAARRGVRVRDEARAPLVSSSSPSELTPPSQRVCRFTLATNRCPNSRAPVSPGEGELADSTGRAALADRPKCNWRIVLLLHDWRVSRSDGCRLTTPGEEVQAGHHENVGVLEVLARRGVELLKFLLIGQAHLDDL